MAGRIGFCFYLTLIGVFLIKQAGLGSAKPNEPEGKRSAAGGGIYRK
jgi:hypothetical protein